MTAQQRGLHLSLYVDGNFASPYALVVFASLIEKGLAEAAYLLFAHA